jgi:hypothetical protein
MGDGGPAPRCPLCMYLPLGLELGNHSVAFPFGHMSRLTPLHPAVAVTTEHVWLEHGALQLAQQARLGVIRQGFLGTSVVLGTDLWARLYHPRGPGAELGLGLGASDSWRARQGLDWDEDAGTYTPSADTGRLGLVAGVWLGLGWKLGPVTPALQYRWFVQSPFLPGIPLGPQGILGVAVRCELGGGA